MGQSWPGLAWQLWEGSAFTEFQVAIGQSCCYERGGGDFAPFGRIKSHGEPVFHSGHHHPDWSKARGRPPGDGTGRAALFSLGISEGDRQLMLSSPPTPLLEEQRYPHEASCPRRSLQNGARGCAFWGAQEG